MATIKSFTSLEQSKKLSEFLPFESADMMYHSVESEYGSGAFVATSKVITNGFENDDFYIDDIPCWSLAALFNVLPSATLDSSDDHHYRVHCNERFTDWYDNPIDCCVAMINRLHEQMIYDFNNK